jgi:hypothetical protein
MRLNPPTRTWHAWCGPWPVQSLPFTALHNKTDPVSDRRDTNYLLALLLRVPTTNNESQTRYPSLRVTCSARVPSSEGVARAIPLCACSKTRPLSINYCAANAYTM